MAVSVRPISHDARLPVLDHLGELRTRLIVSLAALMVAFGFAFWQNHAVLRVLNRPLEHATAGAIAHSRGPLAQATRTHLIPVNADVPDIEVVFVSEPDSFSPVGIKGLGEIGVVSVAAAVANAVYHAIGRRVRSLPITFDQLL